MILAFVGAFLTPLLETIRRWKQLSDIHNFFLWFDDYVVGAVLFSAAWRVMKLHAGGRDFLIATWGFATGMMLGSFFSQLIFIHVKDQAPVSSAIGLL